MFREIRLVSERSNLCTQMHLIYLSVEALKPLHFAVPCVAKIPIDLTGNYLHLVFLSLRISYVSHRCLTSVIKFFFCE